MRRGRIHRRRQFGSILVVDPAPDSAIYALRTIATIRTRKTLTGAISAFKRNRPRLVFTEYRLIGGNGLDMLRYVVRTSCPVPVVFITGYGSEDVCASAFRLGASDYITKPISAPELLCLARRLLMLAPVVQTHDDHHISPIRLSRPARTSVTEEGHSATDAGHSRADLTDRHATSEAARIIEHGFAQPFHLDDVAAAVGLSRFALSHAFSKRFGIPLRAYLIRCRLEHAQYLLKATDHPIGDIARAVGFNDTCRFDKVFKAAVARSPTDYRRARNSNRRATNL
jgi:YesN/AraC family two-component response regulator